MKSDQAVLPTRFSAEAATLGLILVSTGLRALFGARIGLGVGESYYFSAARHPSLSYFDMPPATAGLAALSLKLAGVVSGLVVRAPFIVLFALSTWLLFLIGRRLFGAWPGFYAALLLTLAPVFFLSVGIFLQPEGPLMFFWLACVLCLTHLLVGDRPVERPLLWWSLAGLALGGAMLSKYSAVLLVAGAGLYVLARREQRHWLKHPGPYLALAIAAVLFTPVLIWNARHGWISLLWQGQRGVDYRGLHFAWMIRNLGGQAIELSPWIWIPLLAEVFRSHGTEAADRSRRAFILCLALPPILTFTAVAAYARVGNHFHWGTPGYLMLFVALGATVDQALRKGRALPRLGLGLCAVLSMAFVGTATLQTVTGMFTSGYGALSRWLASGNDATTELIDYTPLREAFAQRGLLDRKDLFIFSDRWYLAGKVDYALRGEFPVLALHRSDPRAYAFFDSSERWLGKEGLLVSTRGALGDIVRDYGSYCSSLEAMDRVGIVRNGREEATLYLYRCRTLVRAFPMPYH
jgi:4-amino-4-deoxy-L-arabinose transferase-like glycosyltransferase